MHRFIHAYMHAYMQAYIHTYIHTQAAKAMQPLLEHMDPPAPSATPAAGATGERPPSWASLIAPSFPLPGPYGTYLFRAPYYDFLI